MGWSYSHTFKAVSFAVLSLFLWTFCGPAEIVYAARNSVQRSALSYQQKKKQEKTEETLNRALDRIERIITDHSLDITSKKDRLKSQKRKIEGFDKEIRKRFADTEKKLIDAGLPERILKRHEWFVERYEHDFNELRKRLDAIDNTVDECQINAEIEKAKILLATLKPHRLQKRFDPKRLPHRKAELVRMKPRTIKGNDQRMAVGNRLEGQIPPLPGDAPLSLWMTEGDLKGGKEDGLLLTAFNAEPDKYFPTFLKGGEGGLWTSPILLASNGTLDGVLGSTTRKIESGEAMKYGSGEVGKLGSLNKEILIAANGPLDGLLSQDSNYYHNPVIPAKAGIQNSGYPITLDSELLTPNSSYSAEETSLSDYIMLAQASDPPTSDDLAETIEVQFTPAITAKAAELGNDPVRIYNWVRNNIEFVPTYGSIQGADYCLQTKQCNAFDTSSLLIALLRVSNIHARYVEGTVEVPIDKVMNWVGGFADAKSTLDLMAAGGIPTGGITSGGEIVKARFEHIWVEAWIDYIPYRGSVHERGDTWIPLDASFKQYNYTNGLDVDTAVPRDVNTLLDEVESQSIIDSAIPSITGMPSVTIQYQLTDFLTQLNEYISTNYPTVNNYYDLTKILHGDRELIDKDMGFLPNSLESSVIAKLGNYSELPDTLRHKISFDLGSADFSYEVSLAYTTSLPEIAGKRITLSYMPATPDDAQVMSNAESILGFPVYLVRVIPELKIEGQTVATGESIGMGQRQSFQITFSNPHNLIDRVDNIIQAGEYYAVGLDINDVSFQYLYDRVNSWQPDIAEQRDDRLGELLHIAAMFHFARLDHFMDELSRSSNIVTLRHPSESMVGMSFNADYIFNTPTNISSVELNMDVDRDVIYPASRTNDTNAEAWFMVQKGLYSSNLEHFTFEELMGFDSVSTVRLLNLANQQNVPIYIIDSENSDRVPELQISPAEKQNILNAIHTGKTVVVPARDIQYIDYSGIGYAVIDPETGAGAYMISDGLNGGSTAIKDDETVRERVKDMVDLGKDLLGEGGELLSIGYKASIKYMLTKYPNIADSPVTEFPDFDLWSKMVLNFEDIGDCEMCDERIKVIMGQQILYYTVIMTMDITDPVY
jgi:hypothetical protein